MEAAIGVVAYRSPIGLQMIEILAIPLGCPPELDKKMLFLKILHILDAKYREIYLELN